MDWMVTEAAVPSSFNSTATISPSWRSESVTVSELSSGACMDSLVMTVSEVTEMVCSSPVRSSMEGCPPPSPSGGVCCPPFSPSGGVCCSAPSPSEACSLSESGFSGGVCCPPPSLSGGVCCSPPSPPGACISFLVPSAMVKESSLTAVTWPRSVFSSVSAALPFSSAEAVVSVVFSAA